MLEEGNSQYSLSQVSRGFTKQGTAKFWIIQILKLFFFLLLPFSVQSDYYSNRYRLWIQSLFWQYDSGYRYGYYFNFNPFFLLVAYILAAPGFYFVHKLRNADSEKSSWKMGVGVIAVSQLLPTLIPTPYIIFPGDTYYSWMP